MEANVQSAKKTFLINSPGDPDRGWAWCQTCQGEIGRVVHHITNWGWLGHEGHILELISESEVLEFGLDAGGFRGRARRLAYSTMRVKYSEDPERFIREVLASLTKPRRKRKVE